MTEALSKFSNLKCKTCRKTYLVNATFTINGSQEARAKHWQGIRFCFECCVHYVGMEMRRNIGRDVTRSGNCIACNNHITPTQKFNPTKAFSSILITDDKTGDKYYFMGSDALHHFNNRVCAKHQKQNLFVLKSIFAPKRDKSNKKKAEIIRNKIRKQFAEFNSTFSENDASLIGYLVGDFLPLTALTRIERLSITRCGKPFRGKKARASTSARHSSDHPLEGIGNSE